MEWRVPSPSQIPAKNDRRSSERFALVVPVALRWLAASGELLQCEGEAAEGNAQGGFVKIPTSIPPGTEVQLQNVLTGEAIRARVVRERLSKEGVFEGLGVAFLTAAPGFWGLTFRLKKATAELRGLEQEIKSGGIHPLVLRDFRDAVDYIRKTAWAVQEWQERQVRQHDTATVLPLLTAERIRRTTELSNMILKDLADQQITAETAGLVELLRAIEILQARLTSSLTARQSTQR